MTKDSKELFSALTTSAAQFASTIFVPEIAGAVAIASPIIQYTVSKCLNRFVKGNINTFDQIDKAKLGCAYCAFCQYVATMEAHNRQLRGASFIDKDVEYSKAEGFMMHLLDCVVKDKEPEKATSYGRIMGEILFSSDDVKDENIVHIVEPVFELTMDDIEVLCYFKSNNVCHFGTLDMAVQSSSAFDDYILYHCLSHLLSLNLLVRVNPCSVTKRIENVRLSPIGVLIKDILNPIVQHTRLQESFNHYNAQ